jgi:hypothetical protein
VVTKLEPALDDQLQFLKLFKEGTSPANGADDDYELSNQTKF